MRPPMQLPRLDARPDDDEDDRIVAAVKRVKRDMGQATLRMHASTRCIPTTGSGTAAH